MKMLQKLFRTLHSTGNVVFGGCWIFTWPYWSWQRDTSSWQTCRRQRNVLHRQPSKWKEVSPGTPMNRAVLKKVKAVTIGVGKL